MMHAKNGSLKIRDAAFDYLVFGTGEKPLIMLPGVGDGFKTAKGMALPFSVIFRRLGAKYRVYAFSRRRDLPEGFTTADMADDLALEMAALGIGKAVIYGVSQGGMIAQQLALRHPERVERLILTVTASRPNAVMDEAIGGWLAMADHDDYRGIMLDTAERSYTGKYLKRSLMQYRLLSRFSKPKDYTRFRVLCDSCLTHDVYDALPDITCPALVIGGRKDRIVTGEASEELAERIPDATLYLYDDLSHGLYEQAEDYEDRLLSWLAGSDEEVK